MGLLEYLSYCKGTFEKLSEFSLVHVVLGGDACDLDTAVCTITYAYYLHETSSASVGTVLFLPVFSIKRAEFRLHTEVTYYLGKFGITSYDLIFSDDIDLLAVRNETFLKLTLVDRHRLPPALTVLEENVLQIFDHRPKDGDLADRCENSIIEPVGSCCTLITEALLEDETFVMDNVIAALLYGAIITDTINLNPVAEKVTPKDELMIEKLDNLLMHDIDRDSVFKEILEAKLDFSGLTVGEILLKDIKVVSGDNLSVATSSVTMDMKDLIEKENFLDQLRSFAENKKVCAVVILTITVGVTDEKNVTRQLGVYSPTRVYQQQIVDVLQNSKSPNLRLSPVPLKFEDFVFFSQENVAASRKHILPIIQAFLSGETTPDETQADAYSDIPRENREGFTSMSSIVGSQLSSADGEISPEDLTSLEETSIQDSQEDEEEFLTMDNKVFDPLSSVYSSDGVSSPTAEGSDFKRSTDLKDSELSAILTTHGADAMVNQTFDLSHNADKSSISEPSDNNVTQDEGCEAVQSLSHQVDLESLSPNCELNNSSDLSSQSGFSFLDVYNASSIPQQTAFDSALLHNGIQEDVFDETASPHEMLFLHDSPAEFSPVATSGQTSGQVSSHESKTSSYPVTPPNSYMDSEFGIVTKETHLPSFNSSEMLEKIQEKKATLGAVSREDVAGVLSPFTPQNSYSVESGFSTAYETQLPSFHNSDMVQRIHEKRSSMERDLGMGSEFDTFLDVQKSPFTPHNSFVEENLDKYAQEHLLSLNNAEIVSKLKQTQVEIVAAPGGVDSIMLNPTQSFTPQNSYVDSHMADLKEDSRSTDLNEVAERLSLTDSESSESLGEPKPIVASNKVHFQGLSHVDDAASPLDKRTRPKVSFGLFLPESDVDEDKEENVDEKPESEQCQVKSASIDKGIESGFTQEKGKDEHVTDEYTDSEESALQHIAFELANEMIQKALETFPSESVQELLPTAASDLRPHPSISEDSSPTVDLSFDDLSRESSSAESLTGQLFQQSAGRDLSSEESITPAINSFSEAAHTEASRTDLNSTIHSVSEQKIEETYDTEDHDGLVDSKVPLDSESVIGEPSKVLLDSKSVQDESGKALLDSSGSSDGMKKDANAYDIETEYLHGMDPLQHMSSYSRKTSVIETGADKEVVESSSFRKISGQEYQTVQEEILEQIRQEALERERVKARQSSVAEEKEVDSDDGYADDGYADDPNEDDMFPMHPSFSESQQSKAVGISEEADYTETFATRSQDSDRITLLESTTRDTCAEKSYPIFSEEFDIATQMLEIFPDTNKENSNLEAFTKESETLAMAKIAAGQVSMPLFDAEIMGLHTDKATPLVDSELSSLSLDTRKVLHPEAVISLDESLVDEEGKKIIHVERDRELYASTLDNIIAEEEFCISEKNVYTESSAQLTLEPLALDENITRKKIPAAEFIDSSLLEDKHSSADAEDADGGVSDKIEEEFLNSETNPLTSEETHLESLATVDSVTRKRIPASEFSDSSLFEDSKGSDSDLLPAGELKETEDAGIESSFFEETQLETLAVDDNVTRKKIPASEFSDSSLFEDSKGPDNGIFPAGELQETENPGSESSLFETGAIRGEEAHVERGASEDRHGDSKQTITVADITDSRAHSGLKDVELKDEWQDDEFPGMIGAYGQGTTEISDTCSVEEGRRKLVSVTGVDAAGSHPDAADVIESDSDIDSDMDNEQLEWENDTPVQMRNQQETIPEYSADEERRDSRSWKYVHIADIEFRIDLHVIEPYKRVLSHGGYYGDGMGGIIVFSGCYLPSKDRVDYSYVMNHLFHYVIHTLDELVAEDYTIVYFHGATPRRQMPSFGWLKRCYQSIDRKLKKNLKALYLVHPTLWLKTIVLMTRPFINSKFSSKLQFVRSLDDLRKLIPMEYVYIPEQVQSYDDLYFKPPASPSSI